MSPQTCYLRTLAIIAVVGTFAGCELREPQRFQFPAMGTLVSVSIYGAPEETASAAVRELESLLTELEHEWRSTGDGALGRANTALAEQARATIDDDLSLLIEDAMALSEQSGGLFDPSLGELIRLWGFDDSAVDDHVVPDETAIGNLLGDTSSLSLEENVLIATRSGVRIDLGAYAKGVALKRAVELLKAAGIPNAIVNMGGDLKGYGRAGDRPWRVGVRHPRDSGVLAGIELGNEESVVTSGDYERYFELDGKRYHHILDPRSGYPAADTISVTVIHEDAARADAAATALFVAGPESWPEVADALGITHVLFVGVDGTIQMTTPMSERVAFEETGEALDIKVREL